MNITKTIEKELTATKALPDFKARAEMSIATFGLDSKIAKRIPMGVDTLLISRPLSLLA